jgi:hypothetical protein
MMILIIKAPGMRLINNMVTISRLIKKVYIMGLLKSMVERGSPFTINPALTKPIRLINNPMPIAVANLIFLGIAIKMDDLISKILSSKNIIPLINMAPRATGGLMSACFIKVTATKAFMPIPGATKIGFLAYQPIAMLERALTMTVAVKVAL